VINLKAVCLQHAHLLAGNPESIGLFDDVADDHSPEFQPYASMERERIAELMDQAFRAGDVRKWIMLAEHLSDKLDAREHKIKGLAFRFAARAARELKAIPSPNDNAVIMDAAFELATRVCKLVDAQEAAADLPAGPEPPTG
jgi:hypothetical protein